MIKSLLKTPFCPYRIAILPETYATWSWTGTVTPPLHLFLFYRGCSVHGAKVLVVNLGFHKNKEIDNDSMSIIE